MYNEEQKEKDKLKCAVKRECPYCKSKNICSLGIGHGLGESCPIKHRFQCNDCQKDFYVVE
jgi:positive regulator of sigma E activity